MSLAFLYLIRCSLHAAALKRNVSNIQRISRAQNAESPLSSVNPGRPRSFSETIDVEYNAAPSSSLPDVMTIEKAKPTNVSLVSVSRESLYPPFAASLMIVVYMMQGGYIFAVRYQPVHLCGRGKFCCHSRC